MTAEKGPQAARRIHDGDVRRLRPTIESDARSVILRNDDHILRRFGALEVLRLSPGKAFSVLRRGADEVWSLLEGTAEIRLEDRRGDSPTAGTLEVHSLQVPSRLLIPFGVTAEGRAGASGALLLRLMTHNVDEDPPLELNGNPGAPG